MVSSVSSPGPASRLDDGLGTVGGPQLVEEVRDVVLHSFNSDGQAVCISLLLWPRAISASTSRSRSANSGKGIDGQEQLVAEWPPR